MTLVEERCGGIFDDINDVMSEAVRTAFMAQHSWHSIHGTAFMAQHKVAAGCAMETVNNAAPLIEKDARLMPA